MAQVLEICEFLYDNKGPGVTDSRLKAYMRRAETYHLTGETQAAIDDIAVCMYDTCMHVCMTFHLTGETIDDIAVCMYV